MAQNADKRIILYPSYIDSTQTVSEGRVLAKDQACAAPDIMEMAEGCKQLNLQCDLEDKHYPRAWWVRGRLRVQLKNPDGSFVNPEITTKRGLMIRIAQLIKDNPKRPPRLHAWTAANALSGPGGPAGGGGGGAGASGSGAASSSKAGGSSSTSNKKKKGKK